VYAALDGMFVPPRIRFYASQLTYSSLIILSFKNHGSIDLLLSLINSGTKTFAEDTGDLVLGVSPPLLPVEMLNVPHSSFQLSIPAVLETIGESRDKSTGSLRRFFWLRVCDVAQEI
jgi:hypothetical protein